MNIKESLVKARQIIDKSGVSNSNLDSILLLAYALSVSKEKVIFNPELEINPQQEKTFFDLISRRANREPVAHLIGHKEFFGESFYVDRNVLSPRPDSETLIELVFNKIPDKNSPLKILEIGSGSGCLTITLLLAYKNAIATALDISKKALSITDQNATSLCVGDRLKLLSSDLFQNLEPEKFDLIISNPPYIPSQDIPTLQEEVRLHEPLLALDGGLDGLDFYRRIALEARKFLKQNALIVLEIGFNQEKEVIKIFDKNHFTLDCAKQDLSGITRILSFKC